MYVNFNIADYGKDNSNYSPNVMFRWTPMYDGEEVAVYVLVMNQALID